MMALKRPREISRLALSLFGTPYIWGGNDVAKDNGLDCSGFARLLLIEAGLFSPKSDDTAAGFYNRYVRVPAPSEGCLVFYRLANSQKVSHVMYCLNQTVCIGAVNGGASTLSVEIAEKQRARVDFRPINYRRELVGYVDPWAGEN